MHYTLPNPFPGAQTTIPSNDKGVKAGNNGTHLVLILDESGSMMDFQAATISGFNEFIETQRKEDPKTIITTVKFEGGNIRILHDAVKINKIKPITHEDFCPCGGTNLFDAIGTSIAKMDRSLSDLKKKKRPNVLFVIFTDGLENMSKEYTSEHIKQMVSIREERCDWAFTFVGANIDAFAVGASFGMRAANTLQYATANMVDTFASVSACVTSYKSMKSRGLTATETYATGTLYSDDDRDKAAGK